MQYFFVEFINEVGDSTFLGGSPALGGAKKVAEKHVQRNGFGSLGAWTSKIPFRSAPRNNKRVQYRIVSRDVNTPDAIKLP